MKVRSPAHIAECAVALDAGMIVVLPTRRWYMLCVDSTDEDACRRIFEGKGRPAAKSLALVMPSNAAVAAAFSLSAEARRLADGLWPGDLALLLPWLPPGPSQDRWWLGARTAMVTRDPWLLGEVAARTRNPLAAAVVSRSDAKDAIGRQPALSSADVRRFVEQTSTPVEILVDGGVCPLGRGLTVVDCSSAARLVREGAVHRRAINAVLGADGSAATSTLFANLDN